jgi:hypothetical protein
MQESPNARIQFSYDWLEHAPEERADGRATRYKSAAEIAVTLIIVVKACIAANSLRPAGIFRHLSGTINRGQPEWYLACRAWSWRAGLQDSVDFEIPSEASLGRGSINLRIAWVNESARWSRSPMKPKSAPKAALKADC